MARGTILIIVATLAAATEALPLPSVGAAVSTSHEAGRRELATHVINGGYGTGSTYGQRNQNSWLGFLVGIALLGIAPMFLVMTELQGRKFSRLLTRARQSTLSNVPSASVHPRMEGQCLHMHGPLSVGGAPDFTDGETGVAFGATAPASAKVDPSLFSFPLMAATGAGNRVASTPLRVMRTVEMWQWIEDERQDSNETTWVYQEQWSEIDIDSSKFHHPRGHENPRRRVPIQSKDFTRESPCLGAFSLSEAAVNRADWWSECKVEEGTPLAPALKTTDARCHGGAILIPAGPSAPPRMLPKELGAPDVGDIRITYKTVEIPASGATIVGVQEGNRLRPYVAKDAKKTLGTASRPGDGGEEDEKLDDMKTMVEGMGEKPNCCQIFTVISTIVAKIMLMIMKHVVGTDVLLLQPGQRAVTMMFVSEEIRYEKALTAFRIVGTILFVAAFYLILSPIAALFSFFPFLSHLISSLFLLAAILIGVACSLITIGGAWIVAKPLRAFFLFLLLTGLYFPAIYYDGASIGPAVLFVGCATVALVIALVYAIQDCRFQAAAKKQLDATFEAAPFVQVAVPVGGATDKGKKEMV